MKKQSGSHISVFYCCNTFDLDPVLSVIDATEVIVWIWVDMVHMDSDRRILESP